MKAERFSQCGEAYFALNKAVRVLDDLIMIVEFTTGEQQLFDATCMLEYPAFAVLADEKVFITAKVEYGVVA